MGAGQRLTVARRLPGRRAPAGLWRSADSRELLEHVAAFGSVPSTDQERVGHLADIDVIGSSSFAGSNPLIEIGPDQTRELRVLVTVRDPIASGASVPVVFSIVPKTGEHKTGGRAASAGDHFFGP